MTYNTLAKICGAISCSSIAYMFLITYEGTYFGWTVFFVFLGFAVLFHSLDEQRDEIVLLRYIIHELKYGLPEEKKNASYAGEGLLGGEAKREIEKKYGSKSWSTPKTSITSSSQNQNAKNLSVEEREIAFIPTWHPGMEKQFGKPQTAEQLLGKFAKQAPSSNEEETQVVFLRKNQIKPTNNNKQPKP